MDDATRARLRALQNRFLADPLVRRQIEQHGEEQGIGRYGPTLREVRMYLLPEWESWFKEFLRNEEGETG